ncbi:hypothetical protein AVEN_130310-1 [Araneus ventricosus]|uniref:Uncharacterized protein n=1 Tax=Araneus ventricosus TaxID=182803 RepID=A0A4Y2BFM4_ARAVE|nr:hypothetical protein AVEN_130310-1 [Araneus ventricosus]
MDPQPRNLAQLATALESAWLNIPVNTFRNLIDSLPARLAAVRSAKGADQVSNRESSFTETVRISRIIFSNEKDWKRNTTKINRMKEKGIMVFRKADSKTTSQIRHDAPRKERKMDPACNCRKCQESRKRGDTTIPGQERQSLFDKFWLTLSWDLKNKLI